MSQGEESVKYEMNHDSGRYEANGQEKYELDSESVNRSEMPALQGHMYELPTEPARVVMDEKRWYKNGHRR